MQPARDEALEPIYDLPEEVISHQHLRALYFLLVERLRRQAEDAGLGAIAFMTAERVAFNYIVLRQKELRTNGIGYVGNQQVTLNKLWLEYSREFAAQVAAAPKQDDLMGKMKQIIFDTVSQQEPSVQRKLAEAFSSAFEREKI